MDIINLGKLIDPNEFQQYIEEADKLETVVHTYGQSFKVPDYPCWMAYNDEAGIEGSISFSRNTHKHLILVELTKKITKVLSSIWVEPKEFSIERVHLIKTINNVTVHKDEAGRLSCINIGVKNSSGAVTKMSDRIDRKDFQSDNEKIELQDGYGYLVNTAKWHSVESVNSSPRYLITYGFGISYEAVKQKLIIKQ